MPDLRSPLDGFASPFGARHGRFNPASIFANGEVGYWAGGYDPAGGRVFQTRNATAVAGAANQPVGVAIDLSQGAALGAEVMVNGDFSAGTTGWVAQGPSSISEVSGTCQITQVSGTGQNRAQQSDFPTVAGGLYITSGQIWLGTSSVVCNIVISGIAQGTGVNSTNPTVQTLLWFATGTNATLFFGGAANAGVGLTHFGDNFSTRRILGNHASQGTAGDRPILRQTGAVWWIENVSSDTLPVTLPAGTYTRAHVTQTGSVTIETGIAPASPENTLRATGQADVLYVNRALTAGEQAALTAYWQGLYA